MPDMNDAEVRGNYHAFQAVVGRLMADHAGKYALLHDRALVDIFPTPATALTAGLEQFGEGLFSVQRVVNRPFDLGFLSYGSGDRVTD